jgi:hypothetical protein
VLVAIFIMGIGLLALLVLFPLAALSMARALKDDRCGTAGANATALFASFNSSSITGLGSPNLDPTIAGPTGLAAPPPAGFVTVGNNNNIGYPVYVDAYYTVLGSTRIGQTGSGPGIPRCGVSYTRATFPQQDNFFTLLDDLTFRDNGTPEVPLERQGRYTWAYMVRPVPLAPTARYELTVVVYSGRSVNTVMGENSYALVGNPAAGSKSVTLQGVAGADPPPVRRGTWLLDTTYDRDNVQSCPVHGHFYRVVSTIYDPAANTVFAEIEPPLRAGMQNPTAVPSMVVMETVAEVFERGTNWYQ